ncbi:aromatic ring-hydroxylating dioxygenase subunit alpha [Phenylobacterium sp. LjRoot225]|uniref:aromatic ring-hydroxylating oxygenase subunit alpha n=1 Tax=Phenylobacterium sp. LjRoot225 TaxID=3342285 RepID=UPI003ECDD76C
MTVMMQAKDARTGDVPFLIDDPEFIPSRRYYDEAFFKLECERLWPHVWQMACRLEEVPNVGDWVEYTLLDKSIIVVRTQTGVKAFHNACRHRGVKFANGSGNCEVQGFNCPFHGWRWNIDGRNTFIYERRYFSEDALTREDVNLLPCRVELWGGCAFINFDDDAPPLRESLGSLADRLEAHNVDKLKVDWWHSAVLPVNWKLAMEAFMEGYHVMRTHPQLHVLTPPGMSLYGSEGASTKAPPGRVKSVRDYVELMIDFMRSLHTGMAGMIDPREMAIIEGLRDVELPDDLATAPQAFFGRINGEITRQGREQGIPTPDLNTVAATHPISAVEYIFPHFFLLPFFSAMSSYRVRPLTPETCLFEIWALSLHPEDETREPPKAPAPKSHDDPSFPEIPQQDYSNLPLQQLGLHSQGFNYMRLSKDVEGMISNYQRLIDGYLTGVDAARLSKATQVVCSGYDSPIRDLGF